MCKRDCEIMKTMLEEIEDQISQKKDNSTYRNKNIIADIKYFLFSPAYIRIFFITNYLPSM